MPRVDIDLPRPGWELITLVAVAWAIGAAAPGRAGDSDAVGSPAFDRVQAVAVAEGDVRRLRDEQAVLDRKEDILRVQIEALQEEARGDSGNVDLQTAIATATERLRDLLTDKQRLEEDLRASLTQLWDAQGEAVQLQQKFYRYGRQPGVLSRWPVEPRRGISAGFRDKSYATRFGVPHDGLDIPTPQGTDIAAAADGVVLSAKDNGYGFSSVTLQSDDGITYLYGHVSAILVERGERVRAGGIVARSGGRPGTRGAGLLTTGPHVHVEVIVDGEHRDPLQYLPRRDDVQWRNTPKAQPRFWRMNEARS
ncbi:MAG: peptidase M23 [Candidatus Peregrinibacteria bacterium Gr01-1014_25]|nr:MAG: peptidase M23 [Candidatus Peregrinibacteria bacterium Gr01-1014_25]